MIKLRDYQSEAIEAIYIKWKTKRKLILWSMMGSGKSEMASYIAQECLSDKMPVVMVVRGRELVKNLSERLDKYKIPHSVHMAGHYRFDRSKLIQVCSIDTMISRNDYPYSDQKCVVILDECHKDYSTIFDRYPIQYILGMSATPFAPDMSMYDDYVCPIEPYELRDQGVLVPDKIYCPHVIDTSSLKIVAGDFKRNEVEKLVTDGEIIGNVVRDYISFGEGRPAVCFAVSIEHSKQLRDEFIKQGIRAYHCDANSTDIERNNAKRGLEDGSIKVVCNVDIFSVGWDCPAVSCIILARPTWSLIWYLQAVGRGLRGFSGKSDCIILDNAGNVFRHGTPYRPREINLEKPEKGKKKSYKADESVRTCLSCYAVYESKETECPYCGEAPPVRKIKTKDGELKLYHESELERSERIKREAQNAYYKLIWVARKRNLPKSWLRTEIQKKYGDEVMPIIDGLLRTSKLW